MLAVFLRVMNRTAETTAFDFEAVGIDGSTVDLAQFRGQVLLVVNVASRCGFTPQYAGLEMLYRRYRDSGFVVLGFPCNQFGNQEPGTATDIRTFSEACYDVSFPMFGKIVVNGPGAHPLYRFLKHAKKGWLGSDAVKWNFTKFLVGRDGHPIRRYGSSSVPEAIDADIRRALRS